MIISPKHKYIFFKSLKTAGSSVEKGLYETLDENSFCAGGFNPMSQKFEYTQINNTHIVYKEGVPEYAEDRFHQHASPELFFSKIKSPELYKDYRKITIVRNPWDMVLSYYWYTTTMKGMNWDKAGCLIKETDSKFTARRKFMHWLFHPGTFDSHTSLLDNPNGEEAIPIDWLSKTMESYVDDRYITDYMRYEKLGEHFQKLSKFIGEDLQLPRLKSNSKKAKDEHYSYFYNNRSEKVVEIAFSKTIEKFGYKFDRRVK